MLKEKLPHERLALIGLAALAIGAGSYALVKGQKRPAPIVFHDLGSGPAASGPEGSATSQPANSGVLVVDATGAVKNPSLLHLPPGSRVDDAIKAAGGPSADADLEGVNLAAKLVDGSQVFIPHKGKAMDAQVAEAYRGGVVSTNYSQRRAGATGKNGHERASKKEPPSQPISLSMATAEQLESVPGIGPATAQKILDYRQAHGGFASVDELLAVKGIGAKKLDTMRKYLRP